MRDANIWIRLVLAVLATWRVTHLLASEDGPSDIIVRFRGLLGESLLGTLMDCFNCLSLWVAAPFALFVSHLSAEWVVSWLAISGAACLLEQMGHDPVVIQSESHPLEGGMDDVLQLDTRGPTQPSSGGENQTPSDLR